MDDSILRAVDGILKYKLPTLGSAGQRATYRLKGKEKRFVEKREPTLVGKIAEEANRTQGLSQVEVTPDEIKRYLGSKNLPTGAQIKNLAIDFKGDTATMVGIVDVPIPFVGGKINFNLELANNPDGSGLMVTRHHVETKSGTLRSKLGDLEANLSNINSFIADDVNEQLRYNNGFLRVLGIAITEDGKFAFKIQNSAQAVA